MSQQFAQRISVEHRETRFGHHKRRRLSQGFDERIYLRWAYWITQGRRLQVPFVAGKGLSVWVLAAVTPQAANPLLAGRLLTVAVGSIVHAARLTKLRPAPWRLAIHSWLRSDHSRG